MSLRGGHLLFPTRFPDGSTFAHRVEGKQSPVIRDGFLSKKFTTDKHG